MLEDPMMLPRLQAIATALFERRVETSLADVEIALVKWRAGAHGILDTHGAMLHHAARCERTGHQITVALGAHPERLLRDAVDAELLDAAEFQQLVGKAPKDVAPIGVLSNEAINRGPGKHHVVEQLLARGPVHVYVDARQPDVQVPDAYRTDPRLVLRFGLGLTPPIRDFAIDDERIAGTLAFSGKLFHCVLPWPAVYAAMVVGEQQGTLWAEDVPADVRIGTAPEAPTSAQEAPPQRRLTLVE
jgi:stringent starvation protein B